MNEAELSVIGLTCCLVGVFFLANSIIFRKLKNVIAVFFNARMRSLNTIKDYTLNNLQVALGFVFLTFGFLLQMYAKLAGVENITPEQKKDVMVNAIKVLAALQGEGTEALLEGLARDDPDLEVRSTAMTALTALRGE